MRAPVGEPGVESRLSASSVKQDREAEASARTSADLEASFDDKTCKKLDAPSSCVADKESVSVSVCSSSDWEAETTLDATFLGVALVARASHAGVQCLGAHTQDHAQHQSL